MNETTAKHQSHRRGRPHGMTTPSAASRTKHLDHSTRGNLSASSRSCFKHDCRPKSLRSVSKEACSEAQKFLETKHKDILLEYSAKEIGNSVPRPVRIEKELSLSELAGLLSAKLGDAIEKGLYPSENP